MKNMKGVVDPFTLAYLIALAFGSSVVVSDHLASKNAEMKDQQQIAQNVQSESTQSSTVSIKKSVN